jgi:hypothetical protein
LLENSLLLLLWRLQRFSEAQIDFTDPSQHGQKGQNGADQWNQAAGFHERLISG